MMKEDVTKIKKEKHIFCFFFFFSSPSTFFFLALLSASCFLISSIFTQEINKRNKKYHSAPVDGSRNVLREKRRARRKHLRPRRQIAVDDRDVVLEPHADAGKPAPFRRIGREVETGLDREHDVVDEGLPGSSCSAVA